MATALRLVTVLLSLCDIAFNPRSARDPAYCRSLGENIRKNGQQVPIIGFFKNDRFQVADGGCRVEGMRLVGQTEVHAIDLGKEPNEAELLMALASIDLHKQFLPPIDRAKLFQSLLRARGCTAKQAAKDLDVSESKISRYLEFLTLPQDMQDKVNDGTLDILRACAIAQEPDPTRQRELAALAKDMPRNEFVKLAKETRKGNGSVAKATSEVRARPAKKARNITRIKTMADGVCIQISGDDLSLERAVESAVLWITEAKKAIADGLTAESYMALPKKSQVNHDDRITG